METRSLALCLLGCAAVGCAAQELPSTVDVEPKVTTQASALGPGDVIEIKVFREPDLAGAYRVESKGTITFPLIGDVVLLDRRPQEVAEEIRSRLADGYLVDPQVSVFVRESKSQRIYVLGQVNKPGTLPYEIGMNVIEAITTAGGFTKLAASNGVTVTRVNESGQKTSFQARVGDIRAGEARNIQLQPGDIVYVPEAIF